MAVLSSCLFIQNPALLKLSFALQKLRLALVQMRLEVAGLAAAVIQLNLSLVQLGFDAAAGCLCLLQLGLALLELHAKLLLGGAHGGGDLLRDFEELASSVLQRVQLQEDGEQTCVQDTGLNSYRLQKQTICCFFYLLIFLLSCKIVCVNFTMKFFLQIHFDFMYFIGILCVR